jgi:hypothetical protein
MVTRRRDGALTAFMALAKSGPSARISPGREEVVDRLAHLAATLAPSVAPAARPP